MLFTELSLLTMRWSSSFSSFISTRYNELLGSLCFSPSSERSTTFNFTTELLNVEGVLKILAPLWAGLRVWEGLSAFTEFHFKIPWTVVSISSSFLNFPEISITLPLKFASSSSFSYNIAMASHFINASKYRPELTCSIDDWRSSSIFSPTGMKLKL